MSAAPQQKPKDSPPARGRLKRILISAAVLAVAAGGVAVISALPPREKKIPAKKVPPVNVEVIRVEPVDRLPHIFKLPGQIEPLRVVSVAAEVAGRIAKIDCREGRPCRKGDKLLWLNTDLLSAQFRQAKAAAEFDQRELARLATLRQRDVATATEVDTARAKADASKAALDLAQANLDRAEIFAPCDGMLNRVPVEEGEYVTSGKTVAQIVQNHQVKIVVDVPERYVKYVKLGDRHRVVMDLDGDREVQGTVSYIGELADEKTRTTRVELTVDNLGPGADLSMPGRSAGTVVLVETRWPAQPAEAVAREITAPLAAALRGVAGVQEVRHGGEDGLGLVSAALDPTIPAAQALARIRDQAAAVAPRLPKTAGNVHIRELALAEYWKLARRGLHAGRLVRVELKLREFHNAILIPLKAVIPKEKGHNVWVVEDVRTERFTLADFTGMVQQAFLWNVDLGAKQDMVLGQTVYGKAASRSVALGHITGWDVVLDPAGTGLKPGDLLIVKGHQFVGPGQAVRVVDGPVLVPPATQPSAASRPASRPGAVPAAPATAPAKP